MNIYRNEHYILKNKDIGYHCNGNGGEFHPIKSPQEQVFRVEQIQQLLNKEKTRVT